jgi:hypothetical protein
MVDQLTLSSHVVVVDDVIPDLDGPRCAVPTARGRRVEESRHGVMGNGLGLSGTRSFPARDRTNNDSRQ